VLNAVQWLVPQARDVEWATKVFAGLVKEGIVSMDNFLNGGEEPEVAKVLSYVGRMIQYDFGHRGIGLASEVKSSSPSPADFLESYLSIKNRVVIFGFEGFDSHWTVATSVDKDKKPTGRREDGFLLPSVWLYDSWQYNCFDKRDFVWAKDVPDKEKSDKIVVDEKDINGVYLIGM
jgi:hypothetical protein